MEMSASVPPPVARVHATAIAFVAGAEPSTARRMLRKPVSGQVLRGRPYVGRGVASEFVSQTNDGSGV